MFVFIGECESLVAPEETTAHFNDKEILTEMGNDDGLQTQVTDHENLETEDDEGKSLTCA